MAFLPFTNDFEEGTNGTTITTGNSGGTGETAFNSVVIGTGASVVFSNTQAAHGNLSASFATGSTTSSAYVSWTTGSQSTIYGRFYLYLTSNPPSATRLLEFWNGGDNVTYCAGLDLSSSGALAIQNSAFSWTANFSNSIPLNQWVRIEFKYTFGTSTGSATVNLYSSADSTTITEGHTVTGQSFGAATADTVDLGYAFSLANQPNMFMDSILLNSVGFPGPATNSVQRELASNLSSNFGSSFTITWPVNPSAGSKVIVGIALFQGGYSSITSVVDNGSTPVTFTQDVVQNGTNGGCSVIYRGDNVQPTGSYTITVTLTSTMAYSAGALAYTNVASGGPTQTNSNTGNSSSPASGFAKSSGSGALYVSVYSSNSGNSETITATGTGFVNEFVESSGSTNAVFAYTDKVDYAGPTNTQSTWTLSDSPFWDAVIAVYDITATTVTGTSNFALFPFAFSSSGTVGGPTGTANLGFQPFAFTSSGTNTGATIFANNIVTGNVINDYGLDNVPYTVGTTGATTMLVAWIGWDVAQASYQSTGSAPAVNVTDSAGNLWRQVGISTVSSSSRGALWVADNPRQTSWVSVALTGWGYSTSYIIAELDGIPTSMQAVSLDFVKTINGTAGTSLTLAATASTSDIGIGVVSTGGPGGGLTVPVNWLGVAAAGGSTSQAASTYAMWTPNISAGALSWNPTWASPQPFSGILIGLKKTAAAPAQPNPNFPVVVVEAAFGATPGDPSQSVDYTWDVTGLTWTDITTRCFSKGDEATIQVSRGRQYELSQEETGEITIKLDNHDGVFTYGNTASPYYPNVIPGVPIRVTAWWQGVQYPVAFGYVEKWPQEWPDMPQWGFSTVTAVDAIGPMAATNLPSAVGGDIKISNPYAYFPTNESYEFTSQSLDPVATPIDANGLIAVNQAFGNNRFAAYRDGLDQPVTTGQALNLLGSQDTTLGATTYTAQETGTNGPGMFYFDPNIPTNTSSQALTAPVQVTPMVRTTGATSGTITLTFSNPVTVGNTVVVCYGSAASSVDAGVSGITLGGSSDNFQVANNTLGNSANSDSQIWFDPNVGVSGATSVVVSYSGGSGGTDEYAIAYEVPGILVLDRIASSQGSGTSFTSSSTAPITNANEIFFAAGGVFSNASATGAGTWTTVSSGTIGTDIDFLSGFQVVSGITTCTFSGTQTSGPYGVAVATFSRQQPTSFSLEYWFVWGNGSAFSNTYLSAWGKPSSFFVKGGAPGNGGVITVGVNTGNNNTANTGFWVNGVEISQGTFNQTTFAPQHFVLTAGPNGTACYLNGVQTGTQPTLGTIPLIRAISLGPARFSYDVNDNVVYNGYNYIAGHLAVYAHELTPQMIANHYTGGFDGWVGTPAPGRFAQVLTWGRLGLKRGGTAWFKTYGTTEDTYVSEAYALENSSAADIINQVVQTEGGRCFTQGNGSVVYLYRWNLYNRPSVVTFGDNNTTEIPFEQDTSFAVDLQFVYNQIQATQTRGPDQEFFVSENNFQSQFQFFNRSGLQISSQAMLPFDVYDIVNWGMTKYNQPVQRVVQLDIDVAKVQGKFPQAFNTVLGLELNEVVTVNRRPVGGATLSTTGSVQKISHNIGAAYWKTSYQIAPDFPENNTLVADVSGQNSPGNQYLSW